MAFPQITTTKDTTKMGIAQKSAAKWTELVVTTIMGLQKYAIPSSRRHKKVIKMKRTMIKFLIFHQNRFYRKNYTLSDKE